MVNVLLVEDNDDDAVAVKRVLRKNLDRGYRVLHARGLMEARALLKTQTRFDIILLDLNLPDTESERDTYESMCRISRDVPIVILTSLSDYGLAVESFGKGLEDYILKSSIVGHYSVLHEKIDYAIHRNQYYQNRIKAKDSEKEHLMHMISGGYSASSSA